MALRPFDEGAGVVDEQLFLHLVADQVAEHDVVHVADRQKGEMAIAVFKAEGTVEGEDAGAIAGIKAGERLIHRFGVFAFL